MSISLKLPVGIQEFEKLRNENYLYLDKTALIWRMVNEGCYYFLSRPRRFGKSLLMSTIQAFFEGKKQYFGLFTLSNLIFLAVLLGVWFLLR